MLEWKPRLVGLLVAAVSLALWVSVLSLGGTQIINHQW